MAGAGGAPMEVAMAKQGTTLNTILAGLLAGFLMGGVAAAEDVAPMQPESAAEPWQEVITSQIDAFRHKDAPGAFQYAAAAFQTSFPSAEAFFVTIVSSGYAPIMESRSHTFGAFKMVDDKTVLQEVKLLGNDQGLYEAFYQLTEEPVGWRVQGVQLMKQPGMGI